MHEEPTTTEHSISQCIEKTRILDASSNNFRLGFLGSLGHE